LNLHSPVSRWLSSLGTITTNAAMQAAGLFIFARTLGPAEYGVIVAATAVAAIAAEFVGFGAGDLLVREVSRNPSAHKSAFGRALRLVALSIVPVTFAAASVAQLWFRTGASFAVMLTLVTSEIVATRFVFLTEQVAVAHHETHAANANRIFATAVRFGIICFAVFAAGVSTASQWAIYAIAWASISAAGCLTMTIRRFGAPDLRAPFKSELHIGVMFSLMQILRAAQYAIDKFAVGVLAMTDIVGSFGIASRASQLGVLPSSAVTRITYPMFFAHGAEGLDAATQLARKIALPVMTVGFVSSATLAAGAYLLPIFLGPKFAPAESFLLIMSLLPVAASLQNLGGSILSGADFQVERVLAMAAGLVMTCVTIFFGASLGGITGAVEGFMVGQFLAACALFAPIPLLRRRARLAAY
jgi:O-antigen/teichoic acid export membrane protein